MLAQLRRIITDKRRLILPIVAGLALNAVIYAAGVYPLSVTARTAAERELTARRELTVAEQEDRGARAVLEGRDRTDRALETFYRDVLPTNLAGARRITYLRLAQLADQEGLQYERRSAEPDPDPGQMLSRLRITMILTGEYEDIRRFIYRLESAPEFVVIDDVSLAQGSEPSSPLTLTLALSTYYRSETNGI